MTITYKGKEYKASKVGFNISGELGVTVFIKGETNTLLEGVSIGDLIIEE